ncbi:MULTISPECIES: recombinase family protein [Klebsiella]|nr:MULTISPECIES: recombinase family protein [Klebsiella]MCI8226351.1 recombinase family protein [Klebsiella pneumoniae]MDK3051999.1 recombinase family protein [Klebsiella michiganensis]MDS0501580.1 recombinase family protein [Klebsiella pneumoniae]HBQ6765824.1 recombinase family protein [Klebsiella pneumoniae]HCK7108184.1 recombinase family protein [Klebsiella pneumoniae]
MEKIIPYGYLRVSSLEQVRSGGGLEAQDDAVRNYINEHSDLFDTDRTVMISDAGLSAFSGQQLSEGQLGVFLSDVETGKVPTGSALVCFSIDRLSRQNPWIGTKLISTLIGAGIQIHSVAERQVLKSDDPVGAIMSTIYLMRANNESEIKSSRAKDGYQQRLLKSIQNKTVLTEQMPRWLFNNDGKYAIDPDMQKIINFTFDSYIAGQSTGYIAKELNDKGWMYGSTSWRGSYVAKLIRDERLIGKHIRYGKQTKGVKREVIETISDFYPVAVDVEKFYLANNMLTNVAEKIRGRTRITYGDTSILRNLFSGVIKCGVCGGDTSVVQNTRRNVVNGAVKYIPYKTFLRCRNKYELKSCSQGDLRYEVIEQAILLHLKSLDINALLNKPIDNTVELYKSELEGCISDSLQYQSMINFRKAENKRVRPDTLEAYENVMDRIDELNKLIESHVVDDFVPDFNIDFDRIKNVSNVAERSVIKKGIASISESIKYRRVSDYILIEIMYRNINAKHVLVIDNKSAEIVVDFSIEYNEMNKMYICNSFNMEYDNSSCKFTLSKTTMEDYAHMMNFVDYVSDDESYKAKEFLVGNFNKFKFLTKSNE